MSSLASAGTNLIVQTEEPTPKQRPDSPPSFSSSILEIAGGQFGAIAIASLAELFFARLLGPGPRGLISLSMMSIAFGSMVGSVGSESTVILWSSKFKGVPATWFPAVLLWVTSGCVVSMCAWGILYWLIKPAFLKGLTPSLALIILVTIPVTISFSMLISMCVGEEKFRLRSLVALINRTSGLLAFLLYVLILGRHAETAMLGNLTGLLVAGAVAFVFLRYFFHGNWRFSEIRQHLIPTLTFGIRGQSGNLATFFSYRLDVFVVNYFLDSSQVGLYALGVLISEALWQIPSLVAIALFPRTARTIDNGAGAFTCMILRQVFLITTATAILVAVLSPLAIPLLFGARFHPSISVIWWILPGTVAFALGKVAVADLMGRGLNYQPPISSFIGLLLTLLLDLLLIPRMGIQGAALASSIAYLGSAIYLLIVLQRVLRSSWSNLLLPTSQDLRAYQRLWILFRSRIRSSSVNQRIS